MSHERSLCQPISAALLQDPSVEGMKTRSWTGEHADWKELGKNKLGTGFEKVTHGLQRQQQESEKSKSEHKAKRKIKWGYFFY